MNRKKFLFYGRLWGITVGGALVAGLDPCSDYLAQQRRRCPEDDLVYAGSGLYDDRIFLSSDSSFFHLYVHGSVDVGLRLPEKGSYLKFPDSEIFKFSGDFWRLTAIFLLLQSRMKGNQVEIQRMKDMFLMSALLLLSGGSVGNLIGVLYNLIGRWVMILYVILNGLTGGMVGVVTELSSTPDINTFGDLLGNTTFLTVAFVAAPVFIAADLIVSWLVLRRTEVRC